jgi:acetyltransferase-like isoleucine patch superfamily enzyme
MGLRLEHDWFAESLPENVLIGERSWLHSSFAFRHYRSRRPIGLRTGTDTGLYSETFFDLGPSGEVIIGNFCTLVGAIICCNSRVIIGDYVLIAHEVVLADSFVATPFDHRNEPRQAAGNEIPEAWRPSVGRSGEVGDPRRARGRLVSADCPTSSTVCEPNDELPTSIQIGDNAWIGARAILLAGARIGQGSIVGAAAVVDFDVPPHTVVAGNPARIVRRVGT